jgi:hypothetical protein
LKENSYQFDSEIYKEKEMADFRKWLPVLAIVALFLGSAMTASAQPAFSCTSNAGVPPIVRAEGLAELVGDLILNCTGGIPTAVGAPVPQVNVQIFLNTNVTSKLTADPASESMLLIDEPAPAAQRLCSALGPTPTAPCGTTGVGSATGFDGFPDGVDYDDPAGSVRNVFQGRQVGAGSLIWLGVPIDPPGTTSTRIIRITNVRANANQLGTSSTLIPTQIVMNVSATGTTSIPINNPQQVVAFIQVGMAFAVRTATDGGTLPVFLQCVNSNVNLSTDSSRTYQTPGGRAFLLRYLENFPSAFKNRATPWFPGSGGGGYTSDVSPTPTPQDIPGAIYNTDSGFYGPVLSGLPNSPGIATNGTRLMARFNNIPAGVVLYVTAYEVNGGSSANFLPGAAGGTTAQVATTSRARLVTTDLNGAGSFSPTAATSTSDNGIAPVALSGGSGIAVWEIMNHNPLNFEGLYFGVAVAYTANTSANLPGLGTGTVNGSFAPLSTVTTASVGAPVPRFADTSASRNFLTIAACSTNLLFPFLTNQSGFDSGIVISNTSVDPFGTSPQSGACKLNYYGETTGGGAAPAAQTSGVIAAGKRLEAVLSSGGNLGIAATPGFQGYVIAQCAFQYAHGFAFISDVGASRLAESYLALILDGNLFGIEIGRTGFFTETLGN